MTSRCRLGISLIVSHLDQSCFSGRSSAGSPAGSGRTTPATWSTPRRGACSVPRDHPTPAPDSPARRQAAEVKMVGYITIAHGIAQRLSEKWRHFVCALLSSLFLYIFSLCWRASRAARTPVRERGHNFWGWGHNFKRQYLRTARTVCHDSKLRRRLKTPREGIVPSPRSGRLRGERADVRKHEDGACTRRSFTIILVKQLCDLHRHFRPFVFELGKLRGHGELYFVSGVLWLPLPAARHGRSARWRLGSRQDPRPPRRPIGGEVRCSGGLGDLGVAFPARSYHAEQMPGHPAVSLACGLLCARFLRMQYGVRNKSRRQEKSLGARGMLVKVGVNRLLRSRHGDHIVTLHRPQVRPVGQRTRRRPRP